MHLFSKKQLKMAAYQKESTETHYQEAEENMYRQIRGWRHDYRNHIQTNEGLCCYRRLGRISIILISGL